MSVVGALPAWAQSQGLYTKGAIVCVIVIVAGLLIATVLKSPSSSDKGANRPAQAPKTSTTSTPSIAAQPSPNASTLEPKIAVKQGARDHKRRAKKQSGPDQTVKQQGQPAVTSYNQSGGITAGQIGSVTVHSEDNR